LLLPRSGLGGYTIEARFALRSQDPNAPVAPPGGPRGRPRTEPRALAWPPWKKDSTSTAAGSLDAGSTAMRLRTGGLSGSSETVTQAVPLPLESGAILTWWAASSGIRRDYGFAFSTARICVGRACGSEERAVSARDKGRRGLRCGGSRRRSRETRMWRNAA